MKKRYMISQPMKGLTDEQIFQNRKETVAKIAKEGGVFIDAFIHEDLSDYKNPPLYSLARSLERMSLCDCVIFLPGWQKARGCWIEHDVAKAYGLEIIEIDEYESEDPLWLVAEAEDA
jgi:hypothetical protein